MIDQVDQRLKAWVGRVVGDMPVSLATPDRSSLEEGVSLYLLELGALPPARTGRRVPLQFSVCYLITVGAQTPERAHHLLGELVFSALEIADFEVELSPVPLELWATLGVPPRPAFRVRVPVRRERAEPNVQRVRFPLVLRSASPEELRGRVVGPGDVPIPGALVELPSLKLGTRTDARGYFHFPLVPPVESLGGLEVRAKGEVLHVGAEALTPNQEPLVIRLPLKEG
ncbi:carboxypeptidase-like regulatory domain-containing protein [Hyalangium rubrum]|uniref:Carboxypeptidase-like regulatory domain-containing protein n=1 Tax=Hyalangium rubrum TaxID=3103134 RepID=A0ABU5H1E2_9BACT|nr:carboxypeptidase-like regulatory domain-containing protein [Hyalangium sp. s54d21]MDY7227267.1 carboxypeptidase-like regulatory domain-containing protein [Hyalangium sp. s54d21]